MSYLIIQINFYHQKIEGIVMFGSRGFGKKINLRVLTEATNLNLSNLSFVASNRMSRMNRSKKNDTQRSTNKCLKSSRKMGTWLETIEEDSTVIIKKQIQVHHPTLDGDFTQKIVQNLSQCFNLCEKINDNFYAYKDIEQYIELLNKSVRQIRSQTLSFKVCSLSGFFLFEYGSYSLSLFYLDKALKALNQKNFLYKFDRITQLNIYKSIAKVFLQKNKTFQAKQFAYKYLRKSWYIENVDEEMQAFDLLGVIELSEGEMELGRYFHWRMCQGIKEKKRIVSMSNQQIDKNKRKKIEYACYQDIMVFVENDRQFNEILDKYYRSQSSDQYLIKPSTRQKKPVFMYTHKSANRNLKTYHLLQRKLIDHRSSKEIHFIKPREIKKLRKLISQFNSLIFYLRRVFQLQKIMDQYEINQM